MKYTEEEMTALAAELLEIDLGLPMLKLTKETWKEVMRYKGKQASVLVNSRVGRLLIVLE